MASEMESLKGEAQELQDHIDTVSAEIDSLMKQRAKLRSKLNPIAAKIGKALMLSEKKAAA